MKFSKFVLVLLVVLTFGFVMQVDVFAQGGDSGFLESCPPGAISSDCQPPTLQQGEFLAVRLLYFAWLFGGAMWTAFLIAIAAMFYSGDQQKIATAKKRFGLWVAGFVIYYLSVPMVEIPMKALIDENECFDQLRDPGFTFFFDDVCTD